MVLSQFIRWALQLAFWQSFEQYRAFLHFWHFFILWFISLQSGFQHLCIGKAWVKFIISDFSNVFILEIRFHNKNFCKMIVKVSRVLWFDLKTMCNIFIFSTNIKMSRYFFYTKFSPSLNACMHMRNPTQQDHTEIISCVTITNCDSIIKIFSLLFLLN